LIIILISIFVSVDHETEKTTLRHDLHMSK